VAMLPAMRRTAAPAIDATVAACCAPATEKAASTCCRPSYIDAARDLYRDAALAPAANLCCTTNPVWQLPELNVPDKMLAMNYGCGTTVHPRDLGGSPSIVYVGVGGGLELLQFAYFSRRRGGVIGLDVVDEMLSACSENLDLAEQINPWFKRSFVDLRKGDAFELPLEDGVIDVAAQNCLFNIFQGDDLGRALSEMHRVLKPKGRVILSDPIGSTEIPEASRRDERLRAMCLTGAISLDAYIERLANVGFGIVEVRARTGCWRPDNSRPTGRSCSKALRFAPSNRRLQLTGRTCSPATPQSISVLTNTSARIPVCVSRATSRHRSRPRPPPGLSRSRVKTSSSLNRRGSTPARGAADRHRKRRSVADGALWQRRFATWQRPLKFQRVDFCSGPQ